MYQTLRMQRIVQVRTRNVCFTTRLLFLFFERILLGLSALRAAHGGAVDMETPKCILLLDGDHVAESAEGNR